MDRAPAERMGQILREGLAAWGIMLTSVQEEQFLRYYRLLVEYNSRMNLTAITGAEEVAVKHFLDSASLLGCVKLPMEAAVIDVGSGAGFPGLPLKILRPDLAVTLLDSLRKRVDFLQVCTEKLGLEGVECVHARAEDAAQQPVYREQYDMAVSRAVANMRTLCEYCLPFVRTGGQLAALKGPAGMQELEEAETAIDLLGGGGARTLQVSIPFGDFSHCILLVDKKRTTPSKYPRKGGKATKSPL